MVLLWASLIFVYSLAFVALLIMVITGIASFKEGAEYEEAYQQWLERGKSGPMPCYKDYKEKRYR